MFFNKIANFFSKKNDDWIAVTDKSARGGKSTIEFSKSEGEVKFYAHLCPIQGNTGPVGFALAKKKVPLIQDLEVFSFNVYAENKFVLSVAFLNNKGLKYQCDLMLQKGKNSFSLTPNSFVLSKWGKPYEDKMESFANISFFENGVLFSRQDIKTYTDFKAQWTLELRS